MVEYRPEGPPWDDGQPQYCLMICPGNPILLLLHGHVGKTRKERMKEPTIVAPSFRFDPRRMVLIDQGRKDEPEIPVFGETFEWGAEARRLLGLSDLTWENRIYPRATGITEFELTPMNKGRSPLFSDYWGLDREAPDRNWSCTTRGGVKTYSIYALRSKGPGKYTDESGAIVEQDYASYELTELTKNPPDWVLREEVEREMVGHGARHVVEWILNPGTVVRIGDRVMHLAHETLVETAADLSDLGLKPLDETASAVP